jgi:ABC-type sulfate/molybdate transport systems ATPase subunit
MTLLEVEVGLRLGACSLRVSFQAADPITALFGPSGAGKTLTLRAIAGLVRPDVGRIVLGERILFDAPSKKNLPARERKIGMVFQNTALFPHLDVRGNVGFGLFGWSVAERLARVDEMLALVGLSDRAFGRVHQLSGGQQQRVALARALAPRPELLLLDEPFSAIDVPLRRQLRSDLSTLIRASGTSVLLVTHDPDDVQALADAVVTLEAGVGVLPTGRPPMIRDNRDGNP